MTSLTKNDMDIKLNGKVAETVKELAKTMGMTPDEIVNLIILWYVEDSESEK